MRLQGITWYSWGQVVLNHCAGFI